MGTLLRPLDKMPLSEQILLSTVQIIVTKKDGIHSGTGYFLKVDVDTSTWVLGIATNRHVLSGGTRFQFRFKKRVGSSVVHDEGFLTDLTPNEASFVEHPDPSIDVTIVILPSIENITLPDGSKIAAKPLDSRLIPDASTANLLNVLEDVVMIGYPIGLSDQIHGVPIVRSGTLATPYWLDFNGKPEFAVDIPAIWGSSGSPILVLNEGSWRTNDGIAMGTRFLWIGMLWGGPQVGGNLPSPAPTTFANPKAEGFPINLGYCIKASAVIGMSAHVVSVLSSQGRI